VNAHPPGDRLQDYLDGILPPGEQQSLREHLGGCAACAARLDGYAQVFAMLADAPLLDPSPSLAERVLDRALPSRVRSRWMRTVGFGYAATLASLLAIAVAWGTQPGARTFAGWVTGEASQRVVQTLKLLIQGVSFLALGLSGSWGTLSTVAGRFAPLGRALASVASHPTVELALWMAGLSCLALLWWLRPRASRDGKGIRHVGLLGV
jgi:predicted anti-sigma-YlaC factor YlaD